MQLPQDFIDKYKRLLKDEAKDFFDSLTCDYESKGFRLNTLKSKAYDCLNDYYPEREPAPYAKDAFIGGVSGKSPLHQAGYVYSQEPSAMIVGSVANVQPGDHVLDLCAAPGGKSTQLATQLKGEGLLVSNEIIPNRAKILSENIERWGSTNVVVTQHAPDELVDHFPAFFDHIIVDAPCSGEGMFRKDQDALEQWTSDYPNICAERQKEILTSAMRMLKHGGYLTYSTCTFAPEENEAIILWLLKEYECQIEPIHLSNVSHGVAEWGENNESLTQTLRLWPHLNQGEGHFVAKIQYLGQEQTPSKKRKKNKKTQRKQQNQLTKEQRSLWEAFTCSFPLNLPGRLEAFGSQLWLVPEGLPSTEGLKILRNGLHLGTFLKKRFEPSFALAMAAIDQTTWPHLDINHEQWTHYVKGETFPYEGNQGWVILRLNQMSVGFARQVQGTIKNFYPKGLRFTP